MFIHTETRIKNNGIELQTQIHKFINTPGLKAEELKQHQLKLETTELKREKHEI